VPGRTWMKSTIAVLHADHAVYRQITWRMDEHCIWLKPERKCSQLRFGQLLNEQPFLLTYVHCIQMLVFDDNTPKTYFI
jgi:hypothetical protein